MTVQIVEILVYSLPSRVDMGGETVATVKLSDDEFIDLAENRGNVNTLHTFFNDIQDITEENTQIRAFIVFQDIHKDPIRIGATADDKLFITASGLSVEEYQY